MSEYNSGKRGKMSEEDLQSVVKNAVTEAVDFIEADISEVRNKSQRYVEGEVDIGHEEGRSKVVSTKLRDTVRVVLPNLMRIFLASRFPVEYIPRTPQQVQSAQQATEFMTAEFDRLEGFQALTDVFNDALTKKVGFIKAYWDTIDNVETSNYTNLSDEELQSLSMEDNLEIIELETESKPAPPPPMGPDGQPMMVNPQTGQPFPTEINTHSATTERTDTTGSLGFDVIAPEDFFIDSGATCFDDALVYGFQQEVRVTDLVAMGFEYDEVVDLGSINTDTDTSDEKYEREDFTTNDLMSRDPSMKLVTVSEAYMKVDMEGDGDAKMHKFILAGKSYKMLDYEPYTGRCIAAFECDPRAHLFFGWSLSDILFNEQDASTSMLRSMLDNLALTNDPRTEVNDEVVNMDDMLDNEIGNLVRVKEMGNINPLVVPFVAGETLPFVQYFDQTIENKTGVNNLSGGLNADLMQNQTATAVNAATQAGANQIESIARNLSQGLKDLFKILLKLLIENSDEEVLMRMSGNRFVPMNPRNWDLEMDMTTNVGLGTGRDSERQAALQGALTIQEKMMAAGSPMVTPENIYNTLADILAISGIKDAHRYFTPVPPPDPNAPQQPEQPEQDPQAQAFLEAEKMKTQQKEQSDQRSAQLKVVEMQKKDDLERDKMAQDAYLTTAEMQAKYGTQYSLAELKALQDAERDEHGRAMSQQESQHKQMLAERQQAQQEAQAQQQAQQQPQGGPPGPGGVG